MNDAHASQPGGAHAWPASTSAIAAANQGALVEALRLRGALSKTQLSEFTGLSAATVNRVLKGLIAQGFVARAGTEESTGGRPPVIFDVVPTSLVSGAVQARRDGITGALVGFDGVIIERFERELDGAESDAGPRALRRMIAHLAERCAAHGVTLHVVGVSVGGIPSPLGTVTGLDPRYWPEATLTELVGEHDVPVIVENDANALALGELYRGVGRSSRQFVALVLDRGLGSGIVANGELVRGARSAAGEVGYLLIDSDSLVAPPQGRGELESKIDPAAVTAAAHGMGIDAAHQFTAAEIVAREYDGDQRAAPVASMVLDMLARGVAALVSILDPDVVVLGEGLDGRADVVIPGLRKRLEGRIQYVPEIRTASLGTDAVLLGVAETALRAVPGPVRISRSA
ncbi:ROK family transcriptional regulator [Leucobacter sp. USHLN153]|uniref:ROK family transcriptional regulator n=1 Tax=Leucobacter sp. USHLN153 TaxID=3081268 RepID=UPI003016E197